MYDDMMRDPAYFAKAKSKVFKIINKSPQDYLQHSKEGFGSDTFEPEQHLVDEYAERVKQGSKMPMPVLSYELNEHGSSFSQEGRHRAYVAIALNASTMPVMVVAGAYPAHEFRDQFADFSHNIFANFK